MRSLVRYDVSTGGGRHRVTGGSSHACDRRGYGARPVSDQIFPKLNLGGRSGFRIQTQYGDGPASRTPTLAWETGVALSKRHRFHS